MQVKCSYCNSDTNKIEKTEAIRIDNKNFHPNCAQKYLDRKELNTTICEIFGFKAPGPRNNAYIKKFEGEGMTFRGMTKALEYFYKVQKNSIEKANNGIGIIPWVYEEAQKYYEKREKMEKDMKEAIEYSKNKEEVEEKTRKVQMPKTNGPRVNVKTYDESEIQW